ncbi:MAG TPA: hypothetical protein VJO34_17465 [Methylomirabilota bacterium]|nr:hypothetical protein [Methylomirabilota bacterium]
MRSVGVSVFIMLLLGGLSFVPQAEANGIRITVSDRFLVSRDFENVPWLRKPPHQVHQDNRQPRDFHDSRFHRRPLTNIIIVNPPPVVIESPWVWVPAQWAWNGWQWVWMSGYWTR